MLGIVAVMVAYILWTSLSVGNMIDKPVALLDSVLPGLTAHRAKAVIYCYSPRCPPCSRMAPDIVRLQEKHPNVFKLDISRHPKESRAIGIRATPTTLLIEDGKVLQALLGANAVPAIEMFLDAR